MKLSELGLNEAIIRAPSHVLQSDVDYALDQYFSGNADINDLLDTLEHYGIDKQSMGRELNQINRTLENPTLIKMKADEHNVSPEFIKGRIKEYRDVISR